MKKIISFIILLTLALAFVSCAKEETPERLVVSTADLNNASYLYDIHDPEIVVSESKYIIYGTITEIKDGFYPEKTGMGDIPIFLNTIKIENVLLGDLKEGEDFEFRWPSGYINYPDYAENQNFSPKMGIDDPESAYQKYKDDYSVFTQFLVYDHPIVEKGEKLITFIAFDEDNGNHSINYLRFVDGKTNGNKMFEDGITFDDAVAKIMDIKDKLAA